MPHGREILNQMRSEQSPYGVARAKELRGCIARELREVRQRYAGIESHAFAPVP